MPRCWPTCSVTLIYRIVEGAYPGDQLASAATSTAAQLVWQRAVWVVVASILSMVLLVLNAIPSLPSELPSITGVALSPLLLVAYWQEYAASPDALSLASNVVGALPPIVNPIKFAPLVAPIADIACALAAGGLTLGDTIRSWTPRTTRRTCPKPESRCRGRQPRLYAGRPARLGIAPRWSTATVVSFRQRAAEAAPAEQVDRSGSYPKGCARRRRSRHGQSDCA